MIQLLSRLEVADNTGAKQVRMIRRLGQLKKTASVGDLIVCHVKESSVDASVKKGSVVRAVVVRTKAPMKRRDGSCLCVSTKMLLLLLIMMDLPRELEYSVLSHVS